MFILDHMPQSAQFLLIAKSTHSFTNGRAGQRQPTYDPHDPVIRSSHRQQPTCLLLALSCLNRDHTVDMCRLRFSQQKLRKEILSQYAQRLRNPGILVGRVLPEMMMAVDSMHEIGSPLTQFRFFNTSNFFQSSRVASPLKLRCQPNANEIAYRSVSDQIAG